MTTCFVCMDDAAEECVVRTCDCTDRWVHPACFAHLLRRVPAHGVSCPVCRHVYNVSPVPRLACSDLDLLSIGILAVNVAMAALVCTNTVLVMYTQEPAPYLVVTACLASFGIFVTVVLLCANMLQRVRCPCYGEITVRYRDTQFTAPYPLLL